MEYNFILVGLQNGTKLTDFLRSKDISYEECGNFKQFKPLLKKGFYNYVLLFKKLSTEDHLLALRDVTLFGGQASIHYASVKDDGIVFDDTLGGDKMTAPLSGSRDEFVKVFMPGYGKESKESE